MPQMLWVSPQFTFLFWAVLVVFGEVGMKKSLQDPMVRIISPCAMLRPWWAVALVPAAATFNATQAEEVTAMVSL